MSTLDEPRADAHIVLIGTCDTKLAELLYLQDRILYLNGVKVTFIDCGRSPVDHLGIDIHQKDLVTRYAKAAGLQQDAGDLSKLERGETIKFLSKCAIAAVLDVDKGNKIHGIVSAGGSGGTSLVAEAMRALPVGVPKLIVSTIASGDTGPIVGETDITLMYSVVDIAGLNEVLKQVLTNAAGAVVGMAHGYARYLDEAKSKDEEEKGATGEERKKRVGITMFGVTTPGVDAIRRHLESFNVEAYVFHATGHGGRAMERLIREGRLDGVIDLTTTEICDFITGGVMNAGPERLDAALERGIPNIISVGATDMTNWGPKETVPEKYRSRKLYEHNPVVTLMRTSKEEAKEVGEFIVKKIAHKCRAPALTQVWIPNGGISMIATPGGPFEDKEADGVLFDTVIEGVNGLRRDIRVHEDERDVNNAEFAKEIAEEMMVLLAKTG